ncbi:MAG: oligosaccharide flippase family protein [Burkholderiales bacterium]
MAPNVTEAPPGPAREGTEAPAATLKKRATSAATITLAGHFAAQFIRLASNLVTTRLLAPADFGVFALGFTVLTAISLFTDLGVRLAVINHKDHDRAFLNTAWSIQVMRGCMIAGVTLVAAVVLLFANQLGLLPSDSVYANANLPWVVAALSVTSIIQGADPMRAWMAQRNLAITRLLALEILAQFVGSLATIAFGFLFRSVWALLLGTVVGSLVRFSLLYRYLPGDRERFGINADCKKLILANSHWIASSSIVGFFVLNGDRVVLGSLFNEHDFGLYTIALTLAGAFQTIVSKLLATVLYPALAEIHRDGRGRMPAALAKVQRTFDLTVVAAAVAVSCLGSLLISTLYDPRYREAGPVLSIIILGTIALRSQITEHLYFITNHSKFATLSRMAQLIAIFAFPVIGCQIWGNSGALWGLVASQFINLPFVLYFRYQQRLLTLASEAALLPSIAAGTAIGLALLYMAHWIHPGV